jgi:hypothetical protein
MKKTIILAVLAVISIGGLFFVKVQADQKNLKEEQKKVTNDYMKCREKFVSAIDTNSDVKNVNLNSLDKPAIENDFEQYGSGLNSIKVSANEYKTCINSININVLNEKSQIDESSRQTVYNSVQKEIEMIDRYLNVSDSFLGKKDQYLKLIDNVNQENYIGIVNELISYLGKSIEEVKAFIPNNPNEIANKITGLSKDFIDSLKQKIDYYTNANKDLENALNSIINS